MTIEKMTFQQDSRITRKDLIPLWQAEDVGLCGGKACNLAKIWRLDIPVPAGFVVTNKVFQEFLDENHLNPLIEGLCKDLEPVDLENIRRASHAIRDLIFSAPIRETVIQSLNSFHSEILPNSTMIVRSSAIGEDSGIASFAGQLDSFLNVNSAWHLEQSLRGCWASYWSERSLCYQLSRGIRLKGMGVVVQEQIRSKISGVLFTLSPHQTADSDEQMLAEYCDGYGDQLVSGRINPGRFTISRRDFVWERQATPEQPRSTHDECLFNEPQITTLCRAGLVLEKEFYGPQDIEWTINQEGRLYFVQSRPITVPLAKEGNGPSVTWSNANVNENYSEPISPLLYSIASAGYYHYFRNLSCAFGISKNRLQTMEHVMRNLIGTHGARMYYNLTNIHAVLRMAPCGDLLIGSFNHFVGAAQTPLPPPNAETFYASGRGRFRQFVELCRISMMTIRQYLSLTRRVETFERIVSDFSERTTPAALRSRTLLGLRDDLRSFLNIRFNRWNNAALADAAAMICYGTLKRLLNRFLPETDQTALHNTLLKGLPGMVSGVPVIKLWELSRRVRESPPLMRLFKTRKSADILACLNETDKFSAFKSELDRFLDDWGFRCSGELMLTVPSFQENPAVLLDILKTYIDLEGESPMEILRNQEAERVAETRRVLRELSRNPLSSFIPWPTRASLVRRFLHWTQHAIMLRERARLKQALLYSRVRGIALSIGGRLAGHGYLGERDDVFFLTYQEIDALISGGSMFPYRVEELVALRKREHADLSKMAPPDVFVLAESEYLAPITATPGRGKVSTTGIGKMSGTGACGGKVTARATILGEVTQANRLVSGDILVTRQTDPGWGPVFFLIKGLVMERGGMLSHGAILAREYGIPTVVGVKDATRLISQGVTISVDGDRGLVEFCD